MPNKLISFIGYDGKFYTILPGHTGTIARAMLLETLIRELKRANGL